MNIQFNIIMGIISLFSVFMTINEYKKTGCVTPWSIRPFCGPQFIYPLIVLCSFFIIFGLLCFRSAWKKHQQEEQDKRNKL